jgi:hypothetical protein
VDYYRKRVYDLSTTITAFKSWIAWGHSLRFKYRATLGTPIGPTALVGFAIATCGLRLARASHERQVSEPDAADHPDRPLRDAFAGTRSPTAASIRRDDRAVTGRRRAQLLPCELLTGVQEESSDGAGRSKKSIERQALKLREAKRGKVAMGEALAAQNPLITDSF